MKKVLFILPFIILAIALSGCEPKETGINVSTTGTAYVGGTAGLELSFLANAPPDTVYDKPAGQDANPFDIAVKIENRGEYEVAAGKCNLEISGIDAGSFGNPDFTQSTTENLVKTRKSGGETIPGTFTIITIPDMAYQSPVSGQIGPFNLRASACYEYQTEASSNICILKDLLGTTRREGICKPTEDKTVENSGAPVAVTALEQSVTGANNIAFTFIIKHVGSDKDVVFKNNNQICDVGDMGEQNKVGVQVILGATDITSSCTGISGGVATLYGNTGAQIRCTQSLPADRGDYTQPLKIILTYDYLQYEDKQITVRQVGT